MGPLVCCRVLRENAPSRPRRPGIVTPVLIRKWTDYIFSVPPPPLLFLLQTCYIQVKIVLQLVPNMLQIASEDIKQNVCIYVCMYVCLSVCLYVCMYVCMYVCLYCTCGSANLCLQLRMGWGSSSVGRVSDRHAADAGLIPRCGKGFFSKPQISEQTLLRCPYTPCGIVCMH